MQASPLRLASSAAALALLLAVSPAAASELAGELSARRARLLEMIDGDTLAVFWSAAPKTYSWDLDYPFRQDSDLLYLTGIEQPETVLVLMPGNLTWREILFVQPTGPRRAHWEGPGLTLEEAAARSGIEAVHPTGELEGFLGSLLAHRPWGLEGAEGRREYARFLRALDDGGGRLGLLLKPAPNRSEVPRPVRDFAERMRTAHPALAHEDVTSRLHALRQVKTPYERRVLARSVAISARGHVAGMRAARPGRFEYEVEAAIEAVYLGSGASGPGYPSIVGSGPNAAILHYSVSSRRMEDGDLLLVDSAARFGGLTGDITRTYPVNGRFTPAQRELYLLVLSAQAAGEEAARAGRTKGDIESAVADEIEQGLLALGLITQAEGRQRRIWNTHGACHWIGMDVHDVGDAARPLQPGMAFVIEPGLYVREEALAQLPDTEANRALIREIRPAVDRFAGLGVRVEDSYLLTEKGLQRLSAGVPREIDEIEALMQPR